MKTQPEELSVLWQALGVIFVNDMVLANSVAIWLRPTSLWYVSVAFLWMTFCKNTSKLF